MLKAVIHDREYSVARPNPLITHPVWPLLFSSPDPLSLSSPTQSLFSPPRPPSPSPHPLPSPLNQPQTPPNIPPHLRLKLPPPLPPHLRRLHIGGALIIRLGEHTHDTDQDLLDALDRAPALGRLLVVQRVVAGGMQDGDADEAVGVDVRVPDLAHEAHARRRERVVPRESQLRREDAAGVGGALGALDQRFPDEDVVFRDRARGDAVRGGLGEGFVFVEEPFGGEGGGHCASGDGGLVRRFRVGEIGMGGWRLA